LQYHEPTRYGWSSKSKGVVSDTIHDIFQTVELRVSLVELLGLLKAEHSSLHICQTNHHFVNAKSERFLKLQMWLTECLDNASANKTLDMNIECVLFQKKTGGKDDNDFSIPFVDVTGIK